MATLLGAACGGALLASAQVPVAPDQASYAAAAQAFAAGDYAAADAALHHFLAAQPGSADGMFLLARVQEAENRPAESLKTLTAAARLRTPTGEDLRIAARDYVLLNDYADALQWSRRAVTMDPGNAEAWYDLGRVQMHEGRFGEAAMALERSVKLRPSSAKALDNWGLCLENQNRPEDALTAYAAAVKAADAMARPPAQPYLDEGKLLLTRGRFADAVPLLQRAAALDPKNAEPLAALGSAEVGLSHPEAARSALETAVALDDSNPRLHYQLARVYKLLRENELADRENRRSAQLYGTHSSE